VLVIEVIDRAPDGRANGTSVFAIGEGLSATSLALATEFERALATAHHMLSVLR